MGVVFVFKEDRSPRAGKQFGNSRRLSIID